MLKASHHETYFLIFTSVIINILIYGWKSLQIALACHVCSSSSALGGRL